MPEDRLLIVPGHGGPDRGACANDIEEAAYVLQTARLLRSALIRGGYPRLWVTLGREVDDEPFGLYKRARIARREDVDMVLSLHLDAAVYDRDRSGMMAYNYPGNNRMFEVGRQVIRAAPEGLRSMDNVSRETNPYQWPRAHKLLGTYHCDALLVEMGFVTNPVDAKLLLDMGVRDALVAALVVGVCHWRRLRSANRQGSNGQHQGADHKDSLH